MLANLLAQARNVIMGSSLLLWNACALAAFDLNMTRGVTPVSREIYNLHMLILWICVVIAIVVFGAMFYSIYHHRKSRGVQAAQFHESTVVEIIWTVIPMLILIAMAVPATKTLIMMENTSRPDVTVKVTGYQWKWKYDYLDEDISFFSNLATPREQINNAAAKGEHYLLEVDNPMVVPVGKKIRILTTAADVIHAWWVPDLGWKRDAIPGFINDNWAIIEKPGIYRGQCAELCGKDHAFMPIVVVAKEEEDYQQWVAEMKAAQAAKAEEESPEREWTMAELMDKGEAVYQANCVACHQANGQGVPGAFPALAGGVITTGPIEGHIDIVINGKPGTAMAAFGAQLGDVELASVITYERNAWGNDMGDLVQPMDIKAQR